MDQRLTKLILYFRNYSYRSELAETSSTTPSQQTYTKWLQQCVANAKAVIELYEQKLNILQVDNQSLIQQNQHMRATIAEDKIQAEKQLEKQKRIADYLRKQLIDKDQQTKILTQKLQQLEITQADQLEIIKNQQTQDASIFENNIHNLKLSYQHLIKTLEHQLNTQTQKNHNLQHKIICLTQQLSQTIASNTKLHQFIEQTIKQQPNHIIHSPTKTHPNQSLPISLPTTSPQPFIPQFQIIDSIYPIHTQDQLLNQSYQQHPTALKDVLNLSACSRFNMREFLMSKEKDKENFDDNVRIFGQCSGEKIYMSEERKRLDMSAGSQVKGYLGQQNHNYKIQQFTTASQSTLGPANQSTLDPYYLFFALTAQCIKINSQHFQEIAQIDIVDKEWEYVIKQRVPMNLWAQHIENKLLESVNK